MTIAAFALPRLKRLREIGFGYPADLGDGEDWLNIVDKMIFAFEWHASDESMSSVEPEYVTEGMTLFAKYFGGLWW